MIWWLEFRRVLFRSLGSAQLKHVLHISEGIISMDAIVSTRGNSFGDMSYMFQLSAAEVERGLASMFAFVNAVFEALDPYRRHVRSLYGAALTNIAFR